jgi:hypothetical protein
MPYSRGQRKSRRWGSKEASIKSFLRSLRYEGKEKQDKVQFRDCVLRDFYFYLFVFKMVKTSGYLSFC